MGKGEGAHGVSTMRTMSGRTPPGGIEDRTVGPANFDPDEDTANDATEADDA